MEIFNSISMKLHDLLTPAAGVLTVAYLIVLSVLVIYGLHRYWLVFLFRRYGQDALTIKEILPLIADFENGKILHQTANLPAITVQIPMFNERYVARRVIEAACTIEYPPELLQIQVLDDSTDCSVEIVRQVCAEMQEAGHNIQFIHRTDRTGFKAGALEEGAKQAAGELIAVFDADFIPNKDILLRTVSYFNDPEIGMVQVRWGHINRNDSLLTRSQAIFLDGHFVIEHTARNRTGRWFNFNGTAGIWRKTCIHDAGGWQHDTLTEDVDLSYRAQLKGWKFIYDPSVVCPAELPPKVSAFKTQQHRWTKGSIQTAIKLLPTIMRSTAPLSTKIEAWFHLTSPIVYVFVVLLSLLFFPAFFVHISPVEQNTWPALFFGLTLFALATASAGTFYLVSQKAQSRSFWFTLLQLPALMALGIGISINNSKAVFEALLGKQSPFVRTPKYNGESSSAVDPLSQTKSKWPAMPPGIIEIALGLLMVMCIMLSITSTYSIVGIPFLLLFAVGYLFVGISSLSERIYAVIINW